MILSPFALDALREIRLPATRVDRPGIWLVSVFVQAFGKEILDELLKAGMVRRGGIPDTVPSCIARTYADNIRRDWQIARFNSDIGTPIYPVSEDVLLVTHAGWRQKKLDALPGRRRSRGRSGGWHPLPVPTCSAGRVAPQDGDNA